MLLAGDAWVVTAGMRKQPIWHVPIKKQQNRLPQSQCPSEGEIPLYLGITWQVTQVPGLP